MKLEHIALTVNDPGDIDAFYHQVLGLTEARRFEVNRDLASSIFDLDEELTAHVMHRDDLCLELFVSDRPTTAACHHVCLALPDRDDLIARAKRGGYRVNRIPRPPHDLFFVYDRSGNAFEIKER